MKEEIVRLDAAIQATMGLLRGGEPLTSNERAIVTSLTWQLLAALHSRVSQEAYKDNAAARQVLPSESPNGGAMPNSTLP